MWTKLSSLGQEPTFKGEEEWYKKFTHTKVMYHKMLEIFKDISSSKQNWLGINAYKHKFVPNLGLRL